MTLFVVYLQLSSLSVFISPSTHFFFLSRPVVDVNINGETQEENQTRAFDQQEEKNKIKPEAAHRFTDRRRIRGLWVLKPSAQSYRHVTH